jgi:transcriptional regulator with XRE-family HTH domain
MLGSLTPGVPRSTFTPEHRRLMALLRELRIEAGLTQNELAGRLERPQSYVSKYESGDRRLDLIELREISEALGSDLRIFVERFLGPA